MLVKKLWSNLEAICSGLVSRTLQSVSIFHSVNPFTPQSDQCQNSPAASQEIWHHTVRRTWLFIAYSDERWFHHLIKFSLSYVCIFSLEGWENVLFELRSERVKWLLGFLIWCDLFDHIPGLFYNIPTWAYGTQYHCKTLVLKSPTRYDYSRNYIGDEHITRQAMLNLSTKITGGLYMQPATIFFTLDWIISTKLEFQSLLSREKQDHGVKSKIKVWPL